MHDEGYVEGPVAPRIEGLSVGSEQEREGAFLFIASGLCVQRNLDLAYKLLASLSRSRLATIHRRIAPLLQFDFVGVRIITCSCKTSWLMSDSFSRYHQNSRSKYSLISLLPLFSPVQLSQSVGAVSPTTRLYGKRFVTKRTGCGKTRHYRICLLAVTSYNSMKAWERAMMKKRAKSRT